MPDKYLYLVIDLGSICVPFLFSFHPLIRFNRKFAPFFIANLVVAAIFIAWDLLYTHLGVWGFNPRYVTGIYFGSLPLEEVLFFICIPFSCTFTYFVLSQYITFDLPSKAKPLTLSLTGIAFVVFGLWHNEKLYTGLTFISLGIFLLAIKIFTKNVNLTKIVLSYIVLLIPFGIVNGLLTGSWIDEPVVWYNQAENLQIRAGTIPSEDFFYGFLLILMNILLFHYLDRKKSV